jgi:hypothetical protein
MAARPASPAAARSADVSTGSAFPLPADGAIEVLGKHINRATSVSPTNGSNTFTDETVRALRVLALDNLVDLVQLRESLSAERTRAAALAAQLQSWRDRALRETREREAEAQEAFRRQRELITVLHRQLVENDHLQDEIALLRTPWWRRRRARRAQGNAATAAGAR